MSAHSVSATAHSSLAALTLIAAVAGGASDLRAQRNDALLAALRSDVEPLLRHDSPMVRGEAAMVLAATRDPRLYDEVLKIANDQQADARLRGIVALGYLAQPSADACLGELLLRSPHHVPERAAAALAVALLPDALPIPALDDYFREVDSGSYRRHRDVLAALFSGFVQEPHPSRGPAMVAMLLDDANRDPELRRLAMTALSANPTQLERADLPRWLASPREPERIGALTAAVRAGSARPLLELEAVERIARRDRSPEVRAAALRLLTDARHRSCLEIAAAATRSADGAEAAAGTRAICRLGGTAMCAQLEKTILAEERPEPQAAMLEAFEAAPSTEFAAACLGLANANRTVAVRAFAAAIAVRGGDRRTGATLRRLFLESESQSALTVLAEAMYRVDPKLIPYDRIYPPASEDDLRLLPLRLRALLEAGDRTAAALLATALRQQEVPDRTKAALLRGLRAATHPSLAPENVALLPPSLRELFS